jgi:site-specific recombinase XerD
MIEQGALFDRRGYKGAKPQLFDISAPTADQTVFMTVPAYHAYLSSGKFSQYTPDDYTADIKRFGQFTGSKVLKDITKGDIRQWIGQMKQTMPPKTLNRKVSAVGNYFRWLMSEHVLEENPAASIRAEKVHAPLPDLLYEEEVERLLKISSENPRTYLLVLLFLETGMKKSELVDLQVGDFDFSNKYQPEVWVKHGGKLMFKDRRLKLSRQVAEVFNDYVDQYKISEQLFPYTQRFLSKILEEAGRRADIRKQVTASILRDMFVVRTVKNGGKLEDAFEKIGLSKTSYDDARKKYGRLTRGAL